MACSFMVKKVDKIRQNIQRRWKNGSRKTSNYRVPSGFLAVYVGPEMTRFVIPARFLNLPVFGGLLKMVEEEHGFEFSGGLEFPCDVSFFQEILWFLEKDENVYGRLSLDEFLKIGSYAGFDFCKEISTDANNLSSPLLSEVSV